ncbi:MAG TPA: heavy-metal-associated domain-containing protein [Gemmatimonadaceae bacterium]|nr:heavy-metal-associated domain-containing protein [Gemmatimonadaceae bacterium]
MERLSLTIEGMSCGHCVAAVDQALRGLESVRIESLTIGAATLEFDPSRVSRADVLDAVDDAGYRAEAAPAA